ncbi:hypothetical protein GMRT_12179 [Giardia muris]|uniref:Uncharacterized protein n=1 Tax=Giardia muris TaxID=5742 RepID=A0A4Z1T415_GIAMU|nr:hypothetical protein GMRT_12179 [Giardia muris]|eukprot:TNJ27787.1 hypothetical protein GMRT_12179 [Giardia muris]
MVYLASKRACISLEERATPDIEEAVERDFLLRFRLPAADHYGVAGVDYVELCTHFGLPAKEASNRRVGRRVPHYYNEVYVRNQADSSIRCIRRYLYAIDARFGTQGISRISLTELKAGDALDEACQTPLRLLYDLGYRPIRQVIRRGLRFENPDVSPLTYDMYREFYFDMSRAFRTLKTIYMLPIPISLGVLLDETVSGTILTIHDSRHEAFKRVVEHLEKRTQLEDEDKKLEKLRDLSLLDMLCVVPTSENCITLAIWQYADTEKKADDALKEIDVLGKRFTRFSDPLFESIGN